MADQLHQVEELIARLHMIKRLAETVVNTSLPSLEHAEQLARSINASIIPDEQVQEIAANATASYETALEALELAQNARSVHFSETYMHRDTVPTCTVTLYRHVL